jgi:hypothetical protein
MTRNTAKAKELMKAISRAESELIILKKQLHELIDKIEDNEARMDAIDLLGN